MVPKPESREHYGDFNVTNSSSSSKRLELLYDGYLYDVTSFVNRHPGGKIIEMYLKTKEDSFHAIQQFHFRSIDRVSAIMKTLSKRPLKDAEDYETRKLSPEQEKRYKEMDKDFMQLFKEAKEEGLFEPSWTHSLMRCMEIPALVIVAAFLYTNNPNSPFWKTMAAIIAALAGGRAGWVLHEGGHNSITGIPKLDKVIMKVYMGLLLGMAGCWWTSQHNRHHAMPNNIKHDVDMKTLPLIAYNTKVVRRPEQRNILIRFQKFLLPTVDIVLIHFFLKVTSIIKAIRQREWFDILCAAVHHIYLIVLTGYDRYACLAVYLGTAYFLINFTLSHTHLPVTLEPVHWIEYSLTHTTNVKSGPFKIVDYWMGYLNYQIEHHLFPTMPQFKNQKIRDRVKALAKKHGLKYNLLSYPTAMYSVFANLGVVAKELYEHEA